MKLSELDFKINYNSYEQDILKEFYIPALSRAIFYDRVSAFFDSKILSRYASGIESIYHNQGKIRFIFSQQLSADDYQLMCEGYQNRAISVLQEKIKKEYLSPIESGRLANLAFLIEKNIVDIKIAFTKSGILHDKFGLIYDENSCIYFRGSNNETIAAIEKNHESFEVSCSWNQESLENKKIEKAKITFDKMWNDKVEGLKVIEMPVVIKKELISYSKGALISENSLLLEDSLVATLSSSGSLILIDNLAQYDFQKDYDYERYIRKYVEEISDNTFYFAKNLTYPVIKKILNQCSISSSYGGYKFTISQKLKDFINSKDIEIEKLKELGKTIKQRENLSEELSSILLPEFEVFSAIVKKEMVRSLYEQQLWDAFFITKMKKSANFSVPGAGKTSIVYGAFSFLNSVAESKVKRIIMIGPLNSFKSWREEFMKCFGYKKKAQVLNIQDSNNPIFALRFDSESHNLILINYELLPRLKDVLLEIIDDETMLVFDEVHKIKAVEGVRASVALEIAKKPKYTVILTGTPLPNSYLDIYNPLHILFPEEYDVFFKYSTAFLKNADSSKTLQINEDIYPFFCRTTKKQLGVPEPNEDVKEFVPMSPKEEKLFSLIHRKYAKNPLALYIRLLQASTNPSLLLNELSKADVFQFFEDENEKDLDNGNYQFNYQYEKSPLDACELIKNMDMSSKFWRGVELVKKLVSEGKQVVVWGIFTQTLERILSELLKKNIKATIIYGTTSLEDREKRIDNFKKKEITVLVTNPHTLAESVSLHETCHDSVYFEYSFNLTHMLQSRDRIHRVGLSDTQYTQYYYLFLKNSDNYEDSIDIKTYSRLKEKEQIMLKMLESSRLMPIVFDFHDDLRYILSK